LADPESIWVIPSEINFRGTAIPGASVETIKEVVEAYGSAAKRAVQAGFDCIEFHAAHGYSPHCFLSKAMNKRTDEYGGTLENRARYLLEAIRSIKGNIPEDMPLLMRVVSKDDYVADGLKIEEIIEFCKMASKAGVDVLDVSRGNKFPIGPNNFGMMLEVPPIDIPRGFNVDNAARIKRETGMITVGVGRINSPEQAEEILASGKTDLVAIGRGQIADPEFLAKAKAGEAESIIRCIGCNQGCYDGITSGAKKITCMRNPAVGREREYALKKAEVPKKVLVIGGGLAGMEAAIVLRQRGHEPVLLEETGEFGGQFLLAGVAPRKAEMREAAISRGKQTEKAVSDVRLNTRATQELLEEIKPDEVIVAIGAAPAKLGIPGEELPNVSSSFGALSGKELPKGRIAVIGGGLVGLEVAECLAEKEATTHVTVVEMLGSVGNELGMLRKIAVMQELAAKGIETITGAKCLAIQAGSISVEKDGTALEIECDSVVIAIGSKPRNYGEVKSFCERKGIPCHVIGDALKARKALNAIADAAEVARAI
jgi:NADPH-dependent 2,4-dienoyl-CoA reductase/sulfur reductase-like enzyme